MNTGIKAVGRMLCFCCILLNCQLGKAQGIDTSVLRKFDASIAARLLKITRHAELSPRSQQAAASYLKMSDSITKAWLLEGRPLKEIDSLQKEQELAFFQLENIRTATKSSLLKDSAMATSFIIDGYMMPWSQFTIAIKRKEFLKISPLVLDSLIYYVKYLAVKQDSLQRLDPFSWIDFGPFESLHLSQLLSEEQYTQLLLIKNKPNARAEAEKDWLEMGRRSMDKGLNKEQTITELTNYYTERYSNWNRWAHNSRTQMINMRKLEETKPGALKLLDAARWNGEPESSDNNLKLQW